MPFKASISPLHALLLVAALLAVPDARSATSISWGTGVGSTMITSTGADFDTSFKFEIGYFVNSFIPTAANTADWNNNWRTWDIAYAGAGYNAGAGFVTRNSSFTGPTTSQANAYYGGGLSYNVPAGAQGYMWVYNDRDHEQGSEWALLTNTTTDAAAGNWLFPSYDSTEPDVMWRTGIEGDTGTVGTVVLGNYAHYEGQNDPDNYDIQTAAIPEPASGLLALLSLFMLNKRRRPN
jgi:hypothetical protein